MKILKRIFQFLFMDRDFANTVEFYNHIHRRDYLEMCERNGVIPNEDQFPFFTYWRNSHKCIAFFAMLLSIMFLCAGVQGIAAGIPASGVSAVFAFCAVCGLYSLIFSYLPIAVVRRGNPGKVVAIRFRSKKKLDRFNSRCEAIEAYVKPYRLLKEQEEKETEQKAQAEREEKRRQEEQERLLYRRKFQVLLEYVETAYRVSTPDPDKTPGKFTINLPVAGVGGVKERCCNLNDLELEYLIVQIASMDVEMRRRNELWSMVNTIAPDPAAPN